MRNVIDLEDVLYEYLTPYDILKALGRFYINVGDGDWDETNHPLHFTTLLENIAGEQKDVKLKDADLNAFAYNALGKLTAFLYAYAGYKTNDEIYKGLDAVKYRFTDYVMPGLVRAINNNNTKAVFKFHDMLLIDLTATNAFNGTFNGTFGSYSISKIFDEIEEYSIDLAKERKNYYNRPCDIYNGNDRKNRIDKNYEEGNKKVINILQEFRKKLEEEDYQKEEIDNIVNKVQAVLIEGKENPHHNMEFSETFINAFINDKSVRISDKRKLLDEVCGFTNSFFSPDVSFWIDDQAYGINHNRAELKHNFKVIVNLDAFIQTFIKNINKKIVELKNLKSLTNYEKEVNNKNIKFLNEVKDKAKEISNNTIDNLIRNTDYHILEILYEVLKNNKVNGNIEEFIKTIDKQKEERLLKIEAEKKQALVNDFESLISSLGKEELNDLYNTLKNNDNIYEKIQEKLTRKK